MNWNDCSFLMWIYILLCAELVGIWSISAALLAIQLMFVVQVYVYDAASFVIK
jgi:hypothetical protein